MAFTKTNYADEADKHGLYFLREPLDCERLGVSVIDVDAGREGPEHDHAADGEVEVYLLVEGDARLTVAGDEIDMEPGDAVRVDPETTRRLTLRGDSRMVVVGAP
jgi:quercetin dioxygenase-like cupin family protein